VPNVMKDKNFLQMQSMNGRNKLDCLSMAGLYSLV
jgi:hypothetical protein